MSNHTRLPPLLMTRIISNVLATTVLYFFSNGVNEDNTSFVPSTVQSGTDSKSDRLEIENKLLSEGL